MKRWGWWLGLWVFGCLVGMIGAAEVQAGYVDHHNGTVSDTRTGLMWQQGEAPDVYTWEEALAHCEASTLAGYTDWRLPSVRELESLVDWSRYDPAIDTDFFPECRSSHYWSGSTYADYPYYAWDVYFYGGYVLWDFKTHHSHVRCVRAGPSGSFGSLTIAQGPMSGPPGTTFVEWGTGFTPNGTATLHFKKPDGTEYPTLSQPLDAIGHFEIQYTAPLDKPPGTYTWWAIDNATGGKSNEVSYVITGEGGVLHHFTFSTIGDQTAGQDFPVTLEARDWAGDRVLSFQGTADLSISLGERESMPAGVRFRDGSASFRATVFSLYQGAIQAWGGGRSGTSNSFTVSGQGSPTGTVHGKVVKGSAWWKDPIVGAEVTLRDRDGQPVGSPRVSDQNGYYTFIGVAAGSGYEVWGTKAADDLAGGPVSLKVTAGKATEAEELKLRSKKRPVLLVPGIMGTDADGGEWSAYPTLPKDMAPDQDELCLHNPEIAGIGDPVGWETIEEKLEDHYEAYEVPYDWRCDLRNADQTYNKYLAKKIRESRRDTGWDKVDIVAHSMGGLMVRSYIQSEDYNGDIDKFVMVGTPNHGSLNAYEMWEGGDPIRADEIHGETDGIGGYFYSNTANNIYQAMKGGKMLEGDIGQIGAQALYKITKSEVRDFLEYCVPSARQLLPTFEALIQGGQSRSISHSRNRNDYLLDLNAAIGDLTKHGIAIKIFGCNGEKTTTLTKVKASTHEDLYEDGAPTGGYDDYDRPASGDGTVPWEKSCKLEEEGIENEGKADKGEHGGLIKSWAKEIVAFLDEGRTFKSVTATGTRRRRSAPAQASPATLALMFQGRTGAYITAPTGQRCGVDDDAGTSYREVPGCEIVRNPSRGRISIEGAADGAYRLVLTGSAVEDVGLHFAAAGESQLEEHRWVYFYSGSVTEVPFTYAASSNAKIAVGWPVTAPGKPSASQSTDGAGLSVLRWTAVAGAAHYRIYRQAFGDPFFSLRGTVDAPTVQYTGDPWGDPPCHYRVSGVSSAGKEGPLSDPVDNQTRVLENKTKMSGPLFLLLSQ